MIDYLLLGCLILGVLFTFLGGGFLLMLIRGKDVYPADKRSFMRKKMFFLSGLTFFISAVISYKIYQYLAFHAIYVLVNFAWWYLAGFVSRIPLLVHNGSLFHRTFSTGWHDVFETFFTALLGPFQLLVTVWGIWKHRREF